MAFGSLVSYSLASEKMKAAMTLEQTLANAGVSVLFVAVGTVMTFRAPSLGRWLYSIHQASTDEPEASAAP